MRVVFTSLVYIYVKLSCKHTITFPTGNRKRLAIKSLSVSTTRLRPTALLANINLTISALNSVRFDRSLGFVSNQNARAASFYPQEYPQPPNLKHHNSPNSSHASSPAQPLTLHPPISPTSHIKSWDRRQIVQCHLQIREERDNRDIVVSYIRH